MQKFRQSLIISEKPGICPKNWKPWRATTIIKSNTFCWNFAYVSYLTMSTIGIFSILSWTWVIKENDKNLVSLSM